MRHRNLEETSGPWCGFWVQKAHRGMMRLTLQFAGGEITGGGTDSSGEFQMRGRYEPDDTVSIVKVYRMVDVMVRGAAPMLVYTGVWNGTFIAGRWHQADFALNAGEIELWPEDEALEADMLSEVREAVNA